MGIVSIYLHFPFYNNRLIFLFIPLLSVPSLLICKTCPPFWKQVYMKVRLHHCMLFVKHLSAISHLFPVYSGSSQQPALSLVFAYLKTHYLHLLSLKNARSQFGIIPRKNTTQLCDTKKIMRIQDLPGTKMDRHTAPVPYIKGLELPLALSKQKSHRFYAVTVWSHPNQPWVVLSMIFICFTFCCHMNN